MTFTKKTYLILLTLILAYPLTAQQVKRHEISIGFGLSEDATFYKIVEKMIADMFTFENDVTINDKKKSGFYLSYKYLFNKRWSAGATLTYKYSKEEQNVNTIINTTKKTKRVKYSQNYYGINLESQYTYLNRRIFRMYALGGVGVYTCKEFFRKTENGKQHHFSDYTTKLTYQISPLCFELGTYIGAKMEYGYGYKGIGSIGLYLRL